MKQINRFNLEKPFIHLFDTNNKYYLYDVNTINIIEIPQEVYYYFNEEKKEVNKDIEDYVQILKANGYLKSTRVCKIQHPMTEMLPYLLKNKMGHMVLQVTQNCNLRCEYCVYSGGYQNREHSNTNMSWDIAKAAIDYMIAHTRDCQSLSLGFYGGEPLLEYDLIQRCVAYAKKRSEGKKIVFNLTTNATLLTEDKVSFFEKYDFNILISLDGPKEIHDMHRKFAGSNTGSFDILMRNIKILKEKHPDFYKNHVGFNTVMDPQNSFNRINDFVMNSEIFGEATFASTIISENYAKEKINYNQEFLSEFRYEVFKVFMHKIGKISKKSISKLLINSVNDINVWAELEKTDKMTEIPEYFHRGGPCIPGVKKIFVSAEGKFYPCERVSESSTATCIGNISDGIDMENVEQMLNIERLTANECKNCWACHFCSNCLIKADNGEQLSGKLILQHCEEVKQSLEEDFKEYCALKELGYKIQI